jgi:hypothetical protein
MDDLYETLFRYVMKEIRGVLHMLPKDNRCHSLLVDVLHHAEKMEAELKKEF